MAESKEDKLYNDLRELVKNQDNKIEAQVSKSLLKQIGGFFLVLAFVFTFFVGHYMAQSGDIEILRGDIRVLRGDMEEVKNAIQGIEKKIGIKSKLSGVKSAQANKVSK